jgi:hypothetical protein
MEEIMSSFLDSTGLSRFASKITDYFAKKDGTYPNMKASLNRISLSAPYWYKVLVLDTGSAEWTGKSSIIMVNSSSYQWLEALQAIISVSRQVHGNATHKLTISASYDFNTANILGVVNGTALEVWIYNSWNDSNTLTVTEIVPTNSGSSNLTDGSIYLSDSDFTTYKSGKTQVTASMDGVYWNKARTALALNDLDQTDGDPFYPLGYMRADTSKRARKALNFYSYHDNANGTIVAIGKPSESGVTNRGMLRLASGNGHYTNIRTANAGDDMDTVIAMPVTGYARVIPVYPATGSGVGSTSQPVYVDANGQVQPCTNIYKTQSVNPIATTGGSWINFMDLTDSDGNGYKTVPIIVTIMDRAQDPIRLNIRCTSHSSVGVQTFLKNRECNVGYVIDGRTIHVWCRSASSVMGIIVDTVSIGSAMTISYPNTIGTSTTPTGFQPGTVGTPA